MDSYQGIPLFFSSTETISCSAWYLKHTGERMGYQEKSSCKKHSFVNRSGSLHVSTSPCSLVMQVKILLSEENVLEKHNMQPLILASWLKKG